MRLEITRKTDLALRAVQELEGSDRTVKGAELAGRIHTTTQFISQVMTPLVRQGWVVSEPGPTGGYSLAADPAVVSLLQLIEAVEGPTADGRCVLRGTPCPPVETCALHDAWTRARDAMLHELSQTPLTEIGHQGGG
jgi:Rrf2 family protein